MTCFTFYCWCNCHTYDPADEYSYHNNLMKSCGKCIGNHEMPIKLWNMDPIRDVVQAQKGDCHA